MRSASVLSVALGALLASAKASAQLAPAPAPDPQELAALEPLLEQHVVVLPHAPWAGAASYITVALRVRAPLARVREALLDSDHYPAMLPALDRATPGARTERELAFELEGSALGVSFRAPAHLRRVGERRVDFVLDPSDLGEAQARWDLTQEGDRTLLVLGARVDLSQACWAVQQVTRGSSWSEAGSAAAAGLALALAVKRSAEQRAGLLLPARPSPLVLQQPLEPVPFDRRWIPVLMREPILLARLDDAGSLRQLQAWSGTPCTVAAVRDRLEDTTQWERSFPHWRSVQGGPWRGAERDVSFTLGTPYAGQRGTLTVRREEAGGRYLFLGRSGDLADEELRWDLLDPHPDMRAISLTARSDHTRAMWPLGLLYSREPYLALGTSLWWRYVTLVDALSGIQRCRM